MDIEFVGDKRFGICVYKNAIYNCPAHIENIEQIACGLNQDECLWQQALVGLSNYDNSHRKCFDWKPTDEFVSSLDREVWSDFISTFMEIKNSVMETAMHYASEYGIRLGYMEVMNFIKYYDGNFFNYHSDDGSTYLSTVSSIAYLNDDYVGGELHFKFLDLTYTPQSGDIVVFPSTFTHSHSANRIDEGVKYSIATMFDYNRQDFIKSIGINRIYFE